MPLPRARTLRNLIPRFMTGPGGLTGQNILQALANTPVVQAEARSRQASGYSKLTATTNVLFVEQRGVATPQTLYRVLRRFQRVSSTTDRQSGVRAQRMKLRALIKP